MFILSQDKTRIFNTSGHIEGIGYKEENFKEGEERRNQTHDSGVWRMRRRDCRVQMQRRLSARTVCDFQRNRAGR